MGRGSEHVISVSPASRFPAAPSLHPHVERNHERDTRPSLVFFLFQSKTGKTICVVPSCAHSSLGTHVDFSLSGILPSVSWL